MEQTADRDQQSTQASQETATSPPSVSQKPSVVKQQKSFMKNRYVLFSIAIAILAIIVTGFGFHIPSLIITGVLQFNTGVHGLFGFGLVLHEPLSSHPISEYIKLGDV